MKVLLVEDSGKVDDGGLATRMRKLPRVRQLYIAGKYKESTQKLGIHIYGEYTDAKGIDRLVAIARREHIDLAVIEPQNPIANEILCAFTNNHVRAFMGLCSALPLFSPPQNYLS